MHEIINYLAQHPFYVSTVIAGFWWIFSSFMSVAPPLPSNAGWWSTAIHNTAQLIAANHGKLSINQNPTQPPTTAAS